MTRWFARYGFAIALLAAVPAVTALLAVEGLI
jgi:hypothetical protein